MHPYLLQWQKEEAGIGWKEVQWTWGREDRANLLHCAKNNRCCVTWRHRSETLEIHDLNRIIQITKLKITIFRWRWTIWIRYQPKFINDECFKNDSNHGVLFCHSEQVFVWPDCGFKAKERAIVRRDGTGNVVQMLLQNPAAPWHLLLPRFFRYCRHHVGLTWNGCLIWLQSLNFTTIK